LQTLDNPESLVPDQARSTHLNNATSQHRQHAEIGPQALWYPPADPPTPYQQCQNGHVQVGPARWHHVAARMEPQNVSEMLIKTASCGLTDKVWLPRRWAALGGALAICGGYGYMMGHPQVARSEGSPVATTERASTNAKSKNP
jgi:hypothetical protein